MRFFKTETGKRFGLNPLIKKIKLYKKYNFFLQHQRTIGKNNNINNSEEELSFVLKKKICRKYYKSYYSIKKYLPKNPLKILDIGCGLGILDIFLFCHYYANPNIKFYLCDKNISVLKIHFRDENIFLSRK